MADLIAVSYGVEDRYLLDVWPTPLSRIPADAAAHANEAAWPRGMLNARSPAGDHRGRRRT